MDKSQSPLFAKQALRANIGDFPESNDSTFAGTDNPRHHRLIEALLMSNLPRTELFRVFGVSSGPRLLAELRALGLTVPWSTDTRDQDGHCIYFSSYSLTSEDREKISTWICEGARKMQARIARQKVTADTRYLTNATKFTGTENPRHLRVIEALLLGHLSRRELDKVSGAANGPQLVSDLRSRGLNLPCRLEGTRDQDGRFNYIGVYNLDEEDRRKIWAWKSKRALKMYAETAREK